MNETKQTPTETPRLSRRAGVAFGGLCAALVAAVAAPVVAVSANDAPAPPAPPVGQFSFCDFAGTSSDTEHDCKRDLISPKGAKIVDAKGTRLAASERDQLAAADLVDPAVDAAADPISFGEAKGATSPTAHAGLSASESRQLFEQTYDILLEELASDPLPADAEIVDVADENTVVIEQPGEGTSLIESPEPIVAGVNDKPIDLDLEAKGQGYEPERPLAEISLPDNAYEPTALGDAGVSFSFEPVERSGGQDGRAAEPVGEEGLFYPKADTDTDLFLTPKADGFEFFAQIRSEQSPEQLRVKVEMPEGASLLESEEIDGAIVVQDAGGEAIAGINPAFATDADGQPFPVSMSVEGADGLLIEVEHRDSGAGYPLLIDPEVNDLFNWEQGASAGSNWSFGKTDSDFLQLEQLDPNNPWVSRGLWNIAPQGKYFSAATEAYWHYWVPNYSGSPSSTSAYIADAWMGSWFTTGSSTQSQPMVVLGQLAPGSGWVRQKVHTQSYGQFGDWMSNTTSLLGGHSQSDSQRLDFRMWNPSGITTNSQRSARLNNVHVKLDDQEAPSADITGIGGWTDGSSNLTATNEATDGGLGVKSQSFGAGVDDNGDNVNAPGVSSSCDGTPDNPCPQNWDEDFTIDPSQLRDGLQVALSGTFDAVGKSALEGEWYGIDRKPPRITEVAGTALDGQGGEALSIQAVDGEAYDRDDLDLDAMANAESGVESIELLIDDVSVAVQSQSCQGDGLPGGGAPEGEVPWGSCEMTGGFTLDSASIGTGSKAATFLVTDAAGNVAEQSLVIEVQNESSAPTPPPIDPDWDEVELASCQDSETLPVDLEPTQELVADSPDGQIDIVEPADPATEIEDESDDGSAPSAPVEDGNEPSDADLLAGAQDLRDTVAANPGMDPDDASGVLHLADELDDLRTSGDPVELETTDTTTVDEVVGEIEPWGEDSNGEPVALDLTISGDDSVTVETASGECSTADYPVVADPELLPQNAVDEASTAVATRTTGAAFRTRYPRQGCRTIKRKLVASGFWKFKMKKRFCWNRARSRAYKKFARAEGIEAGVTGVFVDYTGPDADYNDDYYYNFVRNGNPHGTKSGHWSQRSGTFEVCALRFGCFPGSKDKPYIKIRGHYDGTGSVTRGKR